MNADILLKHFERISDAPDAVTRLRRFILDLAVRGKLVEQDTNDEPAGELLKRIYTEKVRLVKEASIRKQQELQPVSTNDQIFYVPDNWKWARFGEIADFSAGRTPSRHDSTFWNTGGYPWISIADMKDGETIVSTKETVSEKAKSQVFGSDPAVVGTMIMSFKLTIGKIARLGIPAFHNEAIISIRPHLVEMDEYLFRVLPQFSRQGNTKDAIKGATLNRESIANILLPLPPLAEQHRIVAKLDELMALCDQLQAAQNEREARRDRLVAASLHRIGTTHATADEAEIDSEITTPLPEAARFHLAHLPQLTTRPEHIKQLRQTILNLAVRGRLVPQDPNEETATELLKRIQTEKIRLVKDGKVGKVNPAAIADAEIPFAAPVGWEWVRLGQICSKTGSGSTPSGGKDAYIKTGVPFLRSQNVYDDGLRLSNVAFISDEIHQRMKGTAVFPGDLLLNITGGSIGRCAIVPDNFQIGNINQHVAILRLVLEESNAFTHMTIISPYFQNEILRSQTGAGREGLPKNRMDEIAVPLPPLAEQLRIIAKVDELMALCDQLEAQLTTTQTDSRRLLEAVLRDALAPVMEEVAI